MVSVNETLMKFMVDFRKQRHHPCWENSKYESSWAIGRKLFARLLHKVQDLNKSSQWSPGWPNTSLGKLLTYLRLKEYSYSTGFLLKVLKSWVKSVNTVTIWWEALNKLLAIIINKSFQAVYPKDIIRYANQILTMKMFRITSLVYWKMRAISMLDNC